MSALDDEITPIPLDDLATTFKTLKTVAWNYVSGKEGNVLLIEASRLILIEARQQHGDAGYAVLTGDEDEDEDNEDEAP